MFTRVRRHSAGLMIGSCLALGACADAGPMGPFSQPPRVETRYSRLLPGAAMPFVVTNQSTMNWEYGACSQELQRLDGEGWRPASGACMTAPRAQSLGPGERREFLMPLPDEVGIYRVRFRFLHFPDNLATEVFVSSNPFRVGPASPDAAF